MSGEVIDFAKTRRRVPRSSGDFTIPELARALSVVHAAIEEYRRDHEPYVRTARLRTGELAKLLRNSGLKNNNYIIAAFSGEELGLFGSKNFANVLEENSHRIKYMLNYDMVGRRCFRTETDSFRHFQEVRPRWRSNAPDRLAQHRLQLLRRYPARIRQIDLVVFAFQLEALLRGDFFHYANRLGLVRVGSDMQRLDAGAFLDRLELHLLDQRVLAEAE